MRPVKGYVWTGKTDYDEGHKSRRHNNTKQRVMRKWKRWWNKLEMKHATSD